MNDYFAYTIASAYILGYGNMNGVRGKALLGFTKDMGFRHANIYKYYWSSGYYWELINRLSNFINKISPLPVVLAKGTPVRAHGLLPLM